MPVTRTFLDSGVLLAAFKGDSRCHASARNIIDDPDRELLVSDLVRLEVLPKAIYFKNSEEAAFYVAVFRSAARIVSTDQTSVARALQLAEQFGLGAIDACLADAAINLLADEFVTTEGTAKAFFRINVSTTRFISIA